MKSLRTWVALLCLALVGAVLPASTTTAATSEAGTFYPVATSRLLDTRNGTGGRSDPIGPAGTFNLQVTGRGDVPKTGAAAVVVNVTVTGATTGGFVTVYPGGEQRPGVSTINFVKGVTRANATTVKLGANGGLSIYNSNGSTEVIVDVIGYYASATGTTTTGAEFDIYGPDRLHDTRGDQAGALASQEILTIYMDFADGASNGFIRALALNVTAVGAPTGGHLSVYDGGSTLPKTSSLNFSGPAAVANTAVVKTARCTTCGGEEPVQFAVYNGSSASVHVIVDVVGIYFDDGSVALRFQPLSPRRISDSRTSTNAKRIGEAQTQSVTAPTTVASTDTVALSANVTAVGPTEGTFMTLWQGGLAKPDVSNLNAPAGSTVANGAIIPLSATDTFNVYNSAGATHFLIDVSGRFKAGPTISSAPAAQSEAARSRGYDEVSTSSSRRQAA